MTNRFLKCCKAHPILLTTVIFVFVIPLVLTLGITFRNQRLLDQRLKALRDQGLPTNIKELDKFYSVPEGVTDSTKQWEEAFQAIEARSHATEWDNFHFINHPNVLLRDAMSEDIGRAEQLLEDLAAQMELIHKASTTDGHLRLPGQLTLTGSSVSRTWRRTSPVIKLLRLAAAIHLHSGETDAAIKDVVAMFRLANAFESEFDINSIITQNTIYTYACLCLEQALERYPPNQSDSEQRISVFQELILAIDCKQTLLRALIGERAFNLDAIDNSALPTLLTANKLQMLNYFDDFLIEFQQPWTSILSFHKTREQQPLTLLLKNKKTLDLVPAYYLTNFHRLMVVSSMRTTARQRCANAILAAKRFELVTGAFPKSLEEIPYEMIAPDEFSEELLQDPFDNQPLRYKLTDDGLLIYSVGENQTDDGGDCPRDELERGEDIGFWLKQAS